MKKITLVDAQFDPLLNPKQQRHTPTHTDIINKQAHTPQLNTERQSSSTQIQRQDEDITSQQQQIESSIEINIEEKLDENDKEIPAQQLSEASIEEKLDENDDELPVQLQSPIQVKQSKKKGLFDEIDQDVHIDFEELEDDDDDDDVLDLGGNLDHLEQQSNKAKFKSKAQGAVDFDPDLFGGESWNFDDNDEDLDVTSYLQQQDGDAESGLFD